MNSLGESSTSPSPAPGVHPSAIVSADTTNAAPPSQPKPKRKRNRAILSCQPCHDRKQQCDRSQPCKRCVARGAQELCRYDRSIVQTVRNSESERFQTFQRLNQLDRIAPTSTGGLEPTTLLGLETLIQLVQATTSGLAVRNISCSVIPDQDTTPVDHAVQTAAAALGQLSQQLPNHSAGCGQMADFLPHIHGGHEYTPSALSALAELRSHFPNHAITGHLLYFFFNHSSMPWLWTIVHKPTFDSCFLAFSSGHHPPSLDFVALLAMMCTTSLQFLPESPADASIFADYQAGRIALKQRLYDFSRSVLLHDDVLFPTLERIEALLLLAVYQLNEGNIAAHYNTTGTAIRMAQSLNMHQESDPQKFGIIEAETRRRVWWSLFILDRLQCLMLLRPHVIHEQHCNIALPSDSSQIDIQEGAMCTHPSTHVTERTFHILQIHWARLMGRLWETCFLGWTPSYKSILDFEEEIRKFERDLPASFCSQTIQATVNMPYLLFQNRIVTLQIYHARAILLRPILFSMRNPPSEESGLLEFHQSARSVCITSSKRLLAWQLVVQSQADRSQLRWSDFVIRIFDAAVLLSVAIVMDPDNNQNLNDELFEWILIAQHLLKDLVICNPLATSAIRILENVQRHPQVVNISASSVSSATIESSRYLERATFILAQSQPSIADLLGDQIHVDPLWDNERLTVFTGRYPGAEVLCSDADPQAVLMFLDGCTL